MLGRNRDADAATRRGGPRGWDALLYLCNARIAPRASWVPLACARLLLDRGADPRTHAFMYEMPYTAITGAVGIGEAGPVAAPPHPQARALVELLLDAGADPNDEQALYKVYFRATRAGSSCCSRGDSESRCGSTTC